MASSSDPRKVFNDIDTDKSGKLSALEFRNGIRKLGLGLTSREIDQLMIRIDMNGDGVIDYNESINKFGPHRNKEAENLIFERAK